MNARHFVWVAAAVFATGSILAQEKPQQKPQEKKEPAAEKKKKADKNELPLAMTKKLEFETDEGTWISLDLTPDGKSVVFELLGDLYKIPITGGDAARITDGAFYDAQPRVSPDGKWIAFISDRNGSDNLWIAKIDGTEPRKLSNESQDAVISPAWTPDAQYVIATVRATGGAQLRMFHINGGTGIALASTPAPPPAGPAPPAGGAPGPTRLGASVSPDGRYLFVAQAGTGTGLARWQIARLDMRSGDADVITQAEGGGVRPLVSPDGKLVVYATRYETKTGLRLRNLETGEDRWLKWPITRDEQESGGTPSRDTLAGYAFMPDGREIVITNNGKIERMHVDTGATTPVPFKARVSLDVGPELEFPYRVPQGPVRARLIQDPRQSPDGKRLVMSVLTNLYVMDLPATGAPTGKPRRLALSPGRSAVGEVSGQAAVTLPTDNAFKPTWSPDGQWIAYVTWSPEGKGHIWKIRGDGTGQPIQLTKVSAFYTDITFSPDGQRIVGLRGNAYQRQQTFSEFGGLRIPLDLVWVPANGGDVELIVPARGLGRPHFTTDTSRVFVYSNTGLISLRYDGTDRRTHLRVTGPGRGGAPTPPAADAVLIRPDGKWALAEVNNQLWVVAVPPFTGTAPSVSVRGPALPVKRLTDIGSDYFAWGEDGTTITWAIGSTFFRRSFDTIDFTPTEPSGRGAGAPGEGGEDKPEGAAEQKPEGAEGKKPEGAKPKDPLDLDKNVQRVEVSIEVPRAMPKGSIVLRGATIISSKGDEVIQNGDVVVTDNRIVSVGRGVKVPANARVIDARGKFIVPGFVDTHAHWEFRTHDVLEPQNCAND
jgi:Tol biopolymer transport system component